MKFKNKKFTFKKQINTGKYRSFESEVYDIKLDKKLVGHISEIDGKVWSKNKQEDIGKFKIALCIESEEDKGGFKWIYFKNRFDKVEEARIFLNKKFKEITEKFDLFLIDYNE